MLLLLSAVFCLLSLLLLLLCRDPERTSRILASLMAAAQDASINATRPAANAAPAAPTAAANVLNRVAAAVGANQTAGKPELQAQVGPTRKQHST
jgi:hypothetical protein